MKIELTDQETRDIIDALAALPLAMTDPRDQRRRNLVAKLLILVKETKQTNNSKPNGAGSATNGDNHAD